MKTHSDNTIILFLSLFVLIGIFVRLASGYALISHSLTYSPGTRNVLPGTATPADTARSFYMFIDEGEYESAWDISIEPDWLGEAEALYKAAVESSPSSFSGWIGKVDFTERLAMELGKKGTWIRLNNISAQKAEYALDPLTDDVVKALHPEDVHTLRVEGHLLGACSIFQWEKDVVVLTLGGEHKILLEGTKNAKSFFYQSWFSTIERIADLRK
ncbi:MAG: hypothetical protein GY801_00915 [bacterium]|nr:hypothetical protein [bacterium]